MAGPGCHVSCHENAAVCECNHAIQRPQRERIRCPHPGTHGAARARAHHEVLEWAVAGTQASRCGWGVSRCQARACNASWGSTTADIHYAGIHGIPPPMATTAAAAAPRFGPHGWFAARFARRALTGRRPPTLRAVRQAEGVRPEKLGERGMGARLRNRIDQYALTPDTRQCARFAIPHARPGAVREHFEGALPRM
jgi:hypothetical protein